MGEYIREGTTIRDFTPDDDENTIYIPVSATLTEIIDRCTEKWGKDISFDDLTIEAEYIHTECLGYDLHDPSDNTNYLSITRKQS